MSRRLYFSIGTTLLAGCFAVVGFAQDATSPIKTASNKTNDTEAPVATSISDFRAQSLKAMQAGDNDAAIASADAMVRQYREDPRAMRLAGDIYLRCGKFDTAVEMFDRYLESDPEAKAGLWQRGIALYFVGDYKRGAEQFEEHRRVNPEDVENAAWHFLCIAKSESFEKAQGMVLPAPNDPRIPMEEVLQMLTSGETDAVIEKVNRVPKDSEARADADFYGDFYLGLFADARGQRAKAHEHLARAAKDAPHHYMGDIARVYAKYLSK